MITSSRKFTEIVDKKGNWEVLKDGSLYHNIENWHIEPERLSEPDWWLIFRTHKDFDYNSFMPMFFLALETVKMTKIEIKTTYE